VLVLAAEIAKDMNMPLDALTVLERAVQVDPGRSEAYAEQLSVISDLWTAVLGLLNDAIDDSFTRRLDTTLETAFDRLPESMRGDHAHAMADHLIRRGRVGQANEFAYRWLYEGGTLKWWRFDLMLAYAMSFLLLDRVDQAERLVDVIKKGLAQVRANRSMDPPLVHEYGLRLARFEVRVRNARRAEGGA
jgi:hypothetical protein